MFKFLRNFTSTLFFRNYLKMSRNIVRRMKFSLFNIYVCLFHDACTRNSSSSIVHGKNIDLKCKTARRIFYIAKYAFISRDTWSLRFCGVLGFALIVKALLNATRRYECVRDGAQEARLLFASPRVFARGRLYLKRVGFFFVSVILAYGRR